MSGLIDLLQYNLVTLGVALLIGVAAGRWIFGRRPTPAPRREEAPPS